MHEKVQIRIFGFSMIENTQKIIQIGPVIEILWQIVYFCTVNGGHLDAHFVLKVQIHI